MPLATSPLGLAREPLLAPELLFPASGQPYGVIAPSRQATPEPTQARPVIEQIAHCR